jgi:tellurite resistance protein TehA-like permease
MIANYPELTVSYILTASIFIVAYILRIFEIVYYRAVGFKDFEHFYSGLYCAVITMATVGFGDVVPVSHIGRFIIMLAAIWGAFILTLVIVAFSMIFNLNATQKKAMHHLLVTRKAASTIASTWRYYKTK